MSSGIYASPVRLTSPRLAAYQAAWDAQALQAYRACALCNHSTQDAAGARHCNAPALPTQQRPQPVHLTRHRDGHCGPEAVLMQTAWLKPCA